MGLIDDITGKLGLDQGQAEGAVGAIMKLAQGKLAPDHVGELKTLIPGLDGMMQRAPAGGGGGGLLGGLGGMLGGKLGEIAKVVGALESLGIDKSKLGALADVVLGFIKAKGSPGLQGAVQQLLGSLR
jgi:hypothetical protein